MPEVVWLPKGRIRMMGRFLFWGLWKKGRLVLSMAELTVLVAESPGQRVWSRVTALSSAPVSTVWRIVMRRV